MTDEPVPDIQGMARQLEAALRRVEELEERITAPRPPKRRERHPLREFQQPGGCDHKISRDFICGRDKQGRAIWFCSKCEKRDAWGEGWMYYGNAECKRCWQAAIERVYCPACSVGCVPIDARGIEGRSGSKPVSRRARSRPEGRDAPK